MVSTTRKAALAVRRAKRVASLALAEAAYDALLTKEPNESYTFNSGEGSQSATRRKLNELKKQIDLLEAEIDRIDQQVAGDDVVGIMVSRW